MTYPPQPGQPGQPGDPFGQSGWGQGGWGQGGQQPGGYPGYPGQPYPQQPGDYAQYGMYPAGPGGPGGGPPKKKTGLIVGLAITGVVVLAGVLAFTGWVAPGFLTEDDESAGAGNDGSGAQHLAEQIMDGLNNQDATALQQLACDGADRSVRTVLGVVDYIEKAELGDVSNSGNTATADGTVTAEGRSMPVQAELKKDGGSWCWQSVPEMAMGGDVDSSTIPSTDAGDSMPTTAPDDGSGGDSGGEAWRPVSEKFVDAVNSGDGDKAKSMFCSDADTNGDLPALAGSKNARIELGRVADHGEYYAFVLFSGSVDGKQVGEESKISVSNFDDGGWCVDNAWIYPG